VDGGLFVLGGSTRRLLFHLLTGRVRVVSVGSTMRSMIRSTIRATIRATMRSVTTRGDLHPGQRVAIWWPECKRLSGGHHSTIRATIRETIRATIRGTIRETIRATMSSTRRSVRSRGDLRRCQACSGAGAGAVRCLAVWWPECKRLSGG
jgi:hypothetical protein